MVAHMSNTYKIAVLAGDGIGPEVMAAALNVLRTVEKKFSLVFKFNEQPVGGAAIDPPESSPELGNTPNLLDLQYLDHRRSDTAGNFESDDIVFEHLLSQ